MPTLLHWVVSFVAFDLANIFIMFFTGSISIVMRFTSVVFTRSFISAVYS